MEGPAGQVIGEISAKANPAALPQVVEAAETLGADLDLIWTRHDAMMHAAKITKTSWIL